jgi:hypothetical protein
MVAWNPPVASNGRRCSPLRQIADFVSMERNPTPHGYRGRRPSRQEDVAMDDRNDDRDWPAQPEDDVAVGFTPSAGARVLRAIRVPGSLLLIGIALILVGPLPGLGAILVLGGALATAVMGMTALVGR